MDGPLTLKLDRRPGGLAATARTGLASASGIGPAGDAASARAGWLYVVTDDGEPEFTLMRAPAESPGRANWAPVDCPAIAPARSDTRLLGCDVIGDRLLLTLRRGGDPLLAITDLDGGSVIEVPPGVAAGTIRVDACRGLRRGVGDHRAGVADRASGLVPARPGHRRARPAQAARGTRIRARRVPDRAASSRAASGWHADPGHARVPRRTAAGRHRSVPALRLRRLRGVLGSRVQRRPAVPARPRRGLRDRARPRRRRGGPRRGGSRAGCGPSPTTFTDFIDVADWLAGPRRAGRWSTAAGSSRAGCRPAACSRARSTRCAPTAGAPWSPRCRSWTA